MVLSGRYRTLRELRGVATPSPGLGCGFVSGKWDACLESQGKETKDVEKKVVPPKEGVGKETPKREAPRRAEPSVVPQGTPKCQSPWGQAIPVEPKASDSSANQNEAISSPGLGGVALWGRERTFSRFSADSPGLEIGRRHVGADSEGPAIDRP